MKWCYTILFFLYFCHIAAAANILALFSSLSYSDHLVFRGYVSLLTQRGHSVVVMTSYPGQFQHPDVENIVELDVSEESAKFWDEYKNLITNVDDYYPLMKSLNELSLKVAIAQLKSKQMTALLINPNVKFDLVVTDANVPLLYAAADKYNASHIAITPSSGKIHQYEAKGSPTHPLFYPDENTLSYGNIGFWQKITELKRYYHTKQEYSSNYLRLSQLAAEKLLGLKRDLRSVEFEIDVLFVACNPLLVGKRPNALNVAYVDGMHIKTDLTLLTDLKTVLDSATKGVVYFSLGTIQESEQLSPILLQTLADAFGELPYTVLWKIGNTSMIKLSENVIAYPWFPQQEVLAHPNIKAFITHGGLRSLEEAVFYEVPIVGLPLVKSRKTFMGEITKHGAGEILDPYYLEKNMVKTTILAVAGEEKYQTAISLLKSKAEDTAISGPDHAVWWTEYVLRNGGARHLRSPSVGISSISYYMLDILSLLIFAAMTTVYTSYTILRFLIRWCRMRFFGQTGLSGKFKAL
uniref:UDP-glucuronosyltransferase n=1 Tax=Zygaena filipendulae TaxID=287375 RepID=D2JLK9_9NEOP|nr:UGT34A1 [Zygaena filipendulae]